MNPTHDQQNRQIIDQFTRQAEPFARHPAHSTEESLRLVVEAVGLTPDDTLLDVACGPGLTACAFAPHARQITGIDLTPAMIDQARRRQAEAGLDNMDWHVGDVSQLPFADGQFSVAFSRYAFHHLLDPAAVLAEMVRVTRPDGRVVVADVYTSSPEQAAAYDRVERLRDPSHVRALGLEELTGLFRDAGLEDVTTTFYGLDTSLESLLAASFPGDAAADAVRQTFGEDLGVNRLGVNARQIDGDLWFTFPIVIVGGRRRV
jgi:SAM-dependent methyltransferase